MLPNINISNTNISSIHSSNISNSIHSNTHNNTHNSIRSNMHSSNNSSLMLMILAPLHRQPMLRTHRRRRLKLFLSRLELSHHHLTPAANRSHYLLSIQGLTSPLLHSLSDVFTILRPHRGLNSRRNPWTDIRLD